MSIVATHVILERLARMPDAQLLTVINASWEPFEDREETWPSKVAPDRAGFTALLKALTDDWAPQIDVDTPEHIAEAKSR